MKTLLRVLVFGFVAVMATLAALENTQTLRLSLLGYESVELGVFWWLCLALISGLIIGRLTRLGAPRK